MAPASALGATAFTLSASGDNPGIAVDAQGRAHVAYKTGAAPDRVGYCRVPRGSAGCFDIESFGPESDDGDNIFGNVHIFERNGTVDVLYRRCCAPERILLKRSTNGGLDFGPRQLLSNAPSLETADPHDATYGPGGAYSWVDDEGPEYQSAAPGAPALSSADLFPSGQAHTPTVGLHGDVPVVVYQDFSNANPQKDFFWRKYDGSGSRNDATNWTPRQLVAAGTGFLAEARLAEGPSGLFLATTEGAVNDRRLVVRKFTGSGFGPRIVVSPENAQSIDLHQDPSGRLHAVWGANGNAGPSDRLRWRTSANGSSWGPVHTLHVGEARIGTRVGAAADGKGFAVWTNGSKVRMAPLEPLPTVVPPKPQPVTDTLAPSLSGLSLSDSTLKPGQGATFRFRASEPGGALLVIDRAVAGLKLKAKGKRKASCFVQTKKRLGALRKQLAKRGDVKRLRGKRRARKLAALVKRRRCSPWKKVTALGRGVQAGVNSIFFSGKVNGRALKAGRYRAVLIVGDAAGNVSRKQVATFKVVAKKKKRKRGRR